MQLSLEHDRECRALELGNGDCGERTPMPLADTPIDERCAHSVGVVGSNGGKAYTAHNGHVTYLSHPLATRYDIANAINENGAIAGSLMSCVPCAPCAPCVSWAACVVVSTAAVA